MGPDEKESAAWPVFPSEDDIALQRSAVEIPITNTGAVWCKGIGRWGRQSFECQVVIIPDRHEGLNKELETDIPGEEHIRSGGEIKDFGVELPIDISRLGPTIVLSDILRVIVIPAIPGRDTQLNPL